MGLRAMAARMAASSAASSPGGRAHHRAEVGVVVLAEAHVELAGAGQAHAVAAFAEVVGQGRDEADAAAGLGDAGVAGGAAGALGGVGQGPAGVELGAEVAEGPVLVEAVLVAEVAHRHHLDEGEVEAAVAAPGDEAVELVLVDALERHGVDLDAEPGVHRGVEAVEDLGEATEAGDGAELALVEGVEGDVDPADAAVGELVGEAGELAAVGGDGELVEGAAVEVARHGAEEGHDVAADEGLAAGDAELADAEGDEGRARRSSSSRVRSSALGRNSMCSDMQ